jgi:hypothetical protein
VEDYGFNLNPGCDTSRAKTTFVEAVKAFFEGFKDLDFYESRLAIVFVIFALAPLILFITAIVKWLSH